MSTTCALERLVKCSLLPVRIETGTVPVCDMLRMRMQSRVLINPSARPVDSLFCHLSTDIISRENRSELKPSSSSSSSEKSNSRNTMQPKIVAVSLTSADILRTGSERGKQDFRTAFSSDAASIISTDFRRTGNGRGSQDFWMPSNESLCAPIRPFFCFSGERGTLSHRAHDAEGAIRRARLDREEHIDLLKDALFLLRRNGIPGVTADAFCWHR
jgi:hypothetical protein